MKYLWACAGLLALLISLPRLQGAESEYAAGRIVNVEQKTHERFLYNLVNTPVTQQDPYYEVLLRQNTWLYQTEYTPRHAGDSLPGDWISGTVIQMKVADKHHAFARVPGGSELQLMIVKRMLAPPEMDTPGDAPAQK